MRTESTPSGMNRIDPDKRATLRKLAVGAFAAPVVLSFSIGALSITDARAYVGGPGADEQGGVTPAPPYSPPADLAEGRPGMANPPPPKATDFIGKNR